MSVLMELHKIIINENQLEQVIVLREVDGTRQFPIVIVRDLASAIKNRLDGLQRPRPLTHDLLANVIEKLGGTLERINITDLQDGTYFASIVIRQGENKIDIDSRPSDAIAVGVASAVPIYVEEHVLAAACQ